MIKNRLFFVSIVLAFGLKFEPIHSMDLLNPGVTRTVEGAALAIVTELIMRVSYGEEPKDQFSEEYQNYKLRKDSITVFIKTAIDPFFAGNLTENLSVGDPRKYIIDGLFQGAKTTGSKIVTKALDTSKDPLKTTPIIDTSTPEPTEWEAAIKAFEQEKHPMEQCPALPQTSPNAQEPLKEPDSSYWGKLVNTWNWVASTTTGTVEIIIAKVSEQIPKFTNMAFSCAISWLIYKVVQLIIKQCDPTTLACTTIGASTAGVLIPICSLIVNQILEYLYRQVGILGNYYLSPLIKPMILFVSDYLKPAADTLVSVEKTIPEDQKIQHIAKATITQEEEEEKTGELQPEELMSEAITSEKSQTEKKHVKHRATTTISQHKKHKES